MRRYLLGLAPFIASLSFAAGSAQAVVVDMNPAVSGHTSVAYPSDLSSGYYYGVALVPGARQGSSTTASYLAAAGIPVVTSSPPCADPAAGGEPDFLTAGSWPLTAPVKPICWHGGSVIHASEAFTLEWEGQAPNTYWATTKQYVQNFLGDVAGASGSLVTPYADATQYWDGSTSQNRSGGSALFGGGCDDNGTAKCKFGSSTGQGPGNQLPSTSGCPVSGNNVLGGSSGGAPSTVPNNLCITDAEIRNEVASLVDNDGLISNAQHGYTPVVNVLTPPGVVVCLDSAGNLCSANGRLAPPPPNLTTTATGGSLPAGVYQVVITYQTGSGETIPSAPALITTSGSTSTITVSSPPPDSGVTGWYAYMTQANGSSFNQVGTLTPIGTDQTVMAPPSSSGSTPPTKPASFCSYHSVVIDPANNQPVDYVVQPWTTFTLCDEPNVPVLGGLFTPKQLETNAGERLVSPLSQAQMGGLVNPGFTGWFGVDGLEVNDQNSCQPLAQGLDSVSFGNSGQSPYFLQRESNNAAVVDSDPYTYAGCLPADTLVPAFVVPSAVNLGDTVDLDGSSTASSLGIPNANYTWNFGDNQVGSGPSVEHTFAAPGSYTVKLSVTDRGGNVAALSEVLQVLGANGLPVPAPSPTPTGGSGPTGSAGPLTVTLQLLPQALRGVLRHGVALRVSSTEPANGFATITISRRAAKRAHIKTGKHPFVVIGDGTVNSVKDGTVTLHLRMSRSITQKLRGLRHVTLSIRLSLVDSAGKHVSIDVAGNY